MTKKEAQIEKKAVKMSQGDSVWKVVRRALGGAVKDEAVKSLVRRVAELNQVSIPEWGLIRGAKEARAINIGMVLDLSPLMGHPPGN